MTRIDDILRAAVAADDVAGVAAFAADRERVLYAGAFGRRLIDGTALTLGSMFWLASLTKAVTSVAAMQLVERGKIDLDAPLSVIADELASPRVLVGFDAAGSPMTRPAKRPITLRMLLTHTAGFGYDMWSQDLVRYGAAMRECGRPASRAESLNFPLLFDPGEGFAYGVATDWVGRIVERVTGRDLQVVIADAVCAPLGMTDTTFAPNAEQRTRLAGMHARGPDGTLHAVPFTIADPPSFLSGGGGLYGTGGDYLRFLRMLLREGELDGYRVLRRETVELMMRNHIGALTLEPFRTALPRVTNDVDFFADNDTWGLGFLRHTCAREGGRRAGSVSWAGLANTYYWIDPAGDRCGAIFTQQRPFADPAVLRLYERFERAVYENSVEA